MDAGVLAHVLRVIPPNADPDVLVGFETADDAGVYRIAPDLALALTVDEAVDFFAATPALSISFVIFWSRRLRFLPLSRR